MCRVLICSPVTHIFWFVRSKQVARERERPQPDSYPKWNYLKLLIVYRQSITWWCDFNVAYFSPLEFKLSRSTGCKSQNLPVLAQVIISQLIYNFDSMPWNYLSGKYCPFSGFLFEAPSVYPLDPIFPNVSSCSLWGPGRNWINKGSSLPTRRIPFSVPKARKGKSGTLLCTDAQTHSHSFALPLAAETYKFLQVIIIVSLLFEQPEVF